MINSSKVSSIKRNQKEALILKEFSKLFLEITLENPDVRGLIVTRANFSRDKGFCTFLFYDAAGQESFNKKLGTLILYKPSIRSALGKLIPSRYVPEIRFKYDTNFEKEQRVNKLLDDVKADTQS